MEWKTHQQWVRDPLPFFFILYLSSSIYLSLLFISFSLFADLFLLCDGNLFLSGNCFKIQYQPVAGRLLHHCIYALPRNKRTKSIIDAITSLFYFSFFFSSICFELRWIFSLCLYVCVCVHCKPNSSKWNKIWTTANSKWHTKYEGIRWREQN